MSPKETKQLYPLMNVDDMYGSLYSPGDGTLDPASWVAALSRAAVQHGAKIVENCPVINIETSTDDMGSECIKEVVTPAGTIKTNCIVNCGGVWAPNIARFCGVTVPLIAMYHAYVVTERIEGIQNMPNVRDHDASVYLRLQGDGLSVGGYEPNPIFWDEVGFLFAFVTLVLVWRSLLQTGFLLQGRVLMFCHRAVINSPQISWRRPPMNREWMAHKNKGIINE